MPVEYAVDANVILRFVRSDPPEPFRKTEAILKAVEAGEATLHRDPVNLAEVVWVLSSHFKVLCEDTARALIMMVSARGFVVAGKERYV
jgi:predicted nucleic acid-binding protein